MELTRGLFAGVTAGSATGVIAGALYGPALPDGPGWDNSAWTMISLAGVGAVVGTMLGLCAGLTVGVSLRLVRRASPLTAMAVAAFMGSATILLILRLLTGEWATPDRAGWLAAAYVGLAAAVASPWIRRERPAHG